LFIDFLKCAVGLGCLPDVARGRLVQEKLIVAVRNTAQHFMKVADLLQRREFLSDAVMPDRIVALGQCADDGRLVGEILVERAERYSGSLDDVTHPEGVAALFSHYLDRAGKNAFEALATALLGGNEPNDPLAV